MKKQFFDAAVKYLLEQVPEIDDLDERVSILRALPYLLKILKSCMKEQEENLEPWRH